MTSQEDEKHAEPDPCRALEETGIATLAAFHDQQSRLAAWAKENGVEFARLRAAVHIELCDREENRVGGGTMPELNRSQRKELHRLVPMGDQVVEEVARTAKREGSSVRALRQLVDVRLRAHAPSSHERPFGGAHVAARFEAHALTVITRARDLFADDRVEIQRVQRGSDLTADFVMADGTGIIAAFECKAPAKTAQPRRMLELAAVQALMRDRVRDFYAVFSQKDDLNIGNFRGVIERHHLEGQHIVMISDPAEMTSRVDLVLDRRQHGAWVRHGRTVNIDA